MIAALIRHGLYEQPQGVPSAHLPYPLTARGREQAAAAAAGLIEFSATSDLPIDRTLRTSSLRRAWETADILARELTRITGAPHAVIEDDQLAERSLGAAANLTMDAIAQVVASDPRYSPLPDRWKSQSRFRLPLLGAESLLQAGLRTAHAIEGWFPEADESTSTGCVKIFVGHGGAFRHAAASLGVLDLDEVSGLSMHHTRPVYLERHARGRWSQVGGEWKVRPKPAAAAAIPDRGTRRGA